MIKNFLYWLAGNIATIWIGIYFLILSILIKKSCLANLIDFITIDLLWDVLFFIPPIFGGFLLKITKKNIPFYYYITVGTAYYSLYCIITFPHGDGHEYPLIDIFYSETFYQKMIKLIIFSTFGGIIAIILNNIWTYIEKKFQFYSINTKNH